MGRKSLIKRAQKPSHGPSSRIFSLIRTYHLESPPERTVRSPAALLFVITRECNVVITTVELRQCLGVAVNTYLRTNYGDRLLNLNEREVTQAAVLT